VLSSSVLAAGRVITSVIEILVGIEEWADCSTGR
jgi:hypothetical protein